VPWSSMSTSRGTSGSKHRLLLALRSWGSRCVSGVRLSTYVGSHPQSATRADPSLVRNHPKTRARRGRQGKAHRLTHVHTLVLGARISAVVQQLMRA
jgi:hypothetical protein